MRKALLVSSADLEPLFARTVLWRNDVERTFARGPAEALEAASRVRPNLVVIAETNGNDIPSLVRRLRLDPRTRSTAIVALLSADAVLDDQPLREAGVNLVLSDKMDPALWDARLWELLNVPHRRESRVAVRVRDWSGLPADPETGDGLALNISVHGILLESRRRLEVGTNVDLQFKLPGTEEEGVQVVGQVVRQEAVSRSGIKFLVLRGDARDRIRAFVESDRRSRTNERTAALRSRATAERDQWESELHASEARKAAVLEASLDCIVTIDQEGRILDFNSAAERTFGYAQDEVMGKRMVDLIIPPRLRKQHNRGFARYLATGEGPVLGRRVEMTALRADGSEFPVEVAITPILLRGSRLFTGFLRDITERQRAEGILAAQHAVTRFLAESATVAEAAPRILRAIAERFGWDFGAFWTVESDALRCGQTWQVASAEAARLEASTRSTSHARGQGLPGRAWEKSEPLWIQDLSRDPESVRSAASEAGLRTAVALPLLLEGQVLGVMEFFGKQPRLEDAELVQNLLAVGSQIAQFVERKRAEERVRSREARFRALVERSADATALLSRDGRTQYISPSAERVLGYSEYERVGHSPLELAHPEDLERARGLLLNCLASPGLAVSAELRARHKDGAWRWIQVDGVNRLEDPNVAAIVLNYRDVTERKLAEEMLWENAARLQDIVKSTPIVLWAVDRQGVFTLCEGRGLVALGLKPSQLLGRSVFDIYRDQRQICESVRRALVGEELSAVVELGGVRYEAHYAPVRGPAGDIVGASCVGVDITKRPDS